MTWEINRSTTEDHRLTDGKYLLIAQMNDDGTAWRVNLGHEIDMGFAVTMYSNDDVESLERLIKQLREHLTIKELSNE